MKTKWTLLLVLFVSLLITSCYKAPEDITLEDYDITLTYYNSAFDFGTYSTFMVRDSVQLISDYLTDQEKEDFYTNGTADKIRTKIVNSLKSLGYQEVTDDENPDFMINPTLTLVNQSGVIYNPYWWWGYPGYWGWYGDWYYKSTNYYYPPYWAWYPSYGASYYSYKTGSLIMEMADGDSVRAYRDWVEAQNGEVNPNETPQILFNWTAQVEGLVSSTAQSNDSRLENGINEAFTQSPYLMK